MDVASISEEGLTALVLATQDTEAFGELVKRNQTIVRNLLLRMTGDRAAADDLAQEAFLHAFERLDQFRGAGSFRSWLCRVAYTKMLMSVRKRQSETRMRDAVASMHHEGAPQGVEREVVLDLDRALAALDEPERAAVILSYAGNFSHPEIADTLNLPLGTVKSHISRSRAKLRTLLTTKQDAPDER